MRLFEDKKDCCGCGACMNVCPKGAICMKEDACGFLYPEIDGSLCMECGKCKQVCGYQNANATVAPTDAYVAAAQDEALLLQSASGGIFATLAKNVLERKGVVFGCAMEVVNYKLTPVHICVDSIEALPKLQGSKYVQSDMGFTYQAVRAALKENRTVLFSGTPCQVASLYAYLEKPYQNLFTVDIICHGVPSVAMFQAYIAELEKRLKGNITCFQFRNKTAGTGYMGKLVYKNVKGRVVERIVPFKTSSYYTLFLCSEIFRESCYHCKFAGEKRMGDITIGDFWGVGEEHPECLQENGGDLSEEKGISCVLVNTPQGKSLLEQFGMHLEKIQSSFQKAARHNGQLHHPGRMGKLRAEILSLFEKDGYGAIEQWFIKRLGWKRYAYAIWYWLPKKLRQRIKGK